MEVRLKEPVYHADAVRRTNFFNGRFLTAEDLHYEQEAAQSRFEQLGVAVGAGILAGFEVQLLRDGSDGRPAQFSIRPGLGFAPSGACVSLPGEGLQLTVGMRPAGEPARSGEFSDSDGPGPGDEGAYVLVAEGVTGFEGTWPRSYLASGKADSTGRRFEVAGIQFRAISLGTFPQARRRSAVAHACLGTAAWVESHRKGAPLTEASPLSKAVPTSAIPLAVFYWAAGKVEFLDTWAVRRRLAPPPAEVAWAGELSLRRSAEQEALLYQFQEQVAATAPGGSARVHFLYLPAAGLLPSAWARAEFFKEFRDAARTERISPSYVSAILAEGLLADPIDTSQPETPIVVYELDGLASPPQTLFGRWRARGSVEVVQPPAAASGPTLEVKVERLAQERMQVTALEAGGAVYALEPDGRAPGTFRRELPAGDYLVRVEGSQHLTASRRIALQSQGAQAMGLKLIRGNPVPGPESAPPMSLRTDFVMESPQGKVAMIAPLLRWDGVPGHVPGWNKLSLGTKEGVVWLQSWAHYFATVYPEAPVDPSDIHLFFAPRQEQLQKEPYAYAVFGQTGAYCPMICVPKAQTIGRAIPISSIGALPSITPMLYEQFLRPLGIGEFDVFGFAWTKLLEQALGISTRTAEEMMMEARKAYRLVISSHVRAFDGVDERLESMLRQAGFSAPAQLRDILPEELAKKLAAAGYSITLAHACHLVDQAKLAFR